MTSLPVLQWPKRCEAVCFVIICYFLGDYQDVILRTPCRQDRWFQVGSSQHWERSRWFRELFPEIFITYTPAYHCRSHGMLKSIVRIHHLWSDVAVAARGHLSVHGDPKGKHAVVLLSGQGGEGYKTRKYWLPWGVIWNDHAIGDDGSRGRWWRREQAQGVAWVEHQGLVLAEDEKQVCNSNTGLKISPHGGQVVKNQSELSPVGENLV